VGQHDGMSQLFTITTKIISDKQVGQPSRNKLKSLNEEAKNLFRKRVGQHKSEWWVNMV